MNTREVVVASAGMLTSVGFDWPSASAAIRTGISNPSASRFVDWGAEPISVHSVGIDLGVGTTRLARMATMVIQECVARSGLADAVRLPLLICSRATRDEDSETTDRGLLPEIEALLGHPLAPGSRQIAGGRTGGLMALEASRAILHQTDVTIPAVVVAGVDSALQWSRLSALENDRRLLTSQNSNGFVVGEGAAALLVTRYSAMPLLVCEGLGFARGEPMAASQVPFRADELVAAMTAAAAGRCVRRQRFRLPNRRYRRRACLFQGGRIGSHALRTKCCRRA